MEDYTPHDAGNNTHQVGDKFYEESAEEKYAKPSLGDEEIAMKQEEVLLDLLTEKKDEDNIPY